MLAGDEKRIHALRMPLGIPDCPAFGDVDEDVGDDDADDAELHTDGDEPVLDRLLVLAGVGGVESSVRATLLTAMRKAAERRVHGLTGAKRSRHYDHAAELVAAVVECEPSLETAGWVASLRESYRRYPSLRGALDRPVSKC